MRASVFVTALTTILLSTAALAEVPGLISYQGTLTDEDGAALDTIVSVTFSIYTDSTGGALVWSETQTAMQVSHGLFNVLLGRANAISDTVFQDPSRWLGIQVGADPEMQPRQQIVGVGYSFRALEADTADYARITVSDADWTIAGDDVYHAVGNVGIGNASPSTELHVGDSPTTSQKAQIEGLTIIRTNGSGQPTLLRLSNLNGSANSGGSIDFEGLNSGSSLKGAARISGFLTDQSVGSEEGALAFSTSDIGDDGLAERVRIDQDGNVGIGTTNPGASLEVVGAGIANHLMLTNTTSVGPAMRLNAANRDWVIMGSNPGSSVGDQKLVFRDYSGAQDRMVIDQNGNVGIGTKNPAEKLDVQGTVQMTGFKMPPGVSEGYILTADTAGVGSWQPAAAAADSDWTISGNDQYSAVSGNVGIGTSSPVTKLDVRGTVNIGVDDTGHDVNFYGTNSGSRLFWDESKMALRTGRDSDGTHWASDSVGLYSVATGLDTKAKGSYSTAMGGYTTANNYYSTAMGVTTTASGQASIAIGYRNVASGNYSAAMGEGTTASGDWSMAMGNETEASGDRSAALGYYTTAAGDYSVAVGRYVTADSANSIVLGSGTGLYNQLVNDVENSFMVGFNTTEPTLFVGGPDHQVAIGMTDPDAKLTVKGSGVILKGYNLSDEVVVEIGEGLDYSETFPTAQQDIAPGMVMVIDPVYKGRLAMSTEAYDSKVAGIVAGAKGLGSGVRLGSSAGDEGDHAVALAGRVYCNVDARYGDVESGDLLTTSPTPGHAMVVKDFSKAQGAILGKAMESLSGGVKGQILVLVTLQ